MPGGLTWSAIYDNANRIVSEQLVGGTMTNLQFTYQYFGTGSSNVGLLQTKIDKDRSVTNSFAYDAYLHLATNGAGGSLPDQNVTLSYQYDRRGLATMLTQISGTTTLSTYRVVRTFDGYGQPSEETVTITACHKAT